MVVLPVSPQQVEVRIKYRGDNLVAYNARDPEILLEGPAGTGKTRTILTKLHDLCTDHPGLRALIVRKVAVTLGATVLPTLEQEVFTEWDNNTRRSLLDGVHFYGGSEREAAAYVYGNGSRITIGGMDQASKVLGAFYDIIFYNQAEESTEEDIETLKTRLRHGLIPYNRMYLDCNPSHSRHYLLRRCAEGRMRHLKSRLVDNPRYYDDVGEMTEAGREYITNQLEGLTGTRRQRLLLGEWIGVENAIYSAFDRAIHVRPLEQGVRFVKTVIGVDFGDVHDQAAVVLSLDQWNRRWVREVWARQLDDHGAELKRVVGRLRTKYSATGGRTDPNQSVLAGDLGFNVAKRGPFRQHRIDLMGPLFNLYPGGRVPADLTLAYQTIPHGPYAEPDTPGFMIVKDCPGGEHLAERIEAYHYVIKETDTNKETVVARIDEDPVAALEYANEELCEGGSLMALAGNDWSYR